MVIRLLADSCACNIENTATVRPRHSNFGYGLPKFKPDFKESHVASLPAVALQEARDEQQELPDLSFSAVIFCTKWLNKFGQAFASFSSSAAHSSHNQVCSGQILSINCITAGELQCSRGHPGRYPDRSPDCVVALVQHSDVIRRGYSWTAGAALRSAEIPVFLTQVAAGPEDAGRSGLL